MNADDQPDGTGDINTDDAVKLDLLYKDLCPEGGLPAWGVRILVYLNPDDGRTEVRWHRDGDMEPGSFQVTGVLELVKGDYARATLEAWNSGEDDDG